MTPARSTRLTLEHVLLVGVLGVSGGGTWIGNDRLVDELRRTREELAKLTASVEIAVTKLEDHDRRLQNLETLFLRAGGQ